MTATFLAMLVVTLALLFPLTTSFCVLTHAVTRKASYRCSLHLKMAKIKQAPSREFRSRKRYNKWTRMIRRLEEYHAIHGHSRISSTEDPELHKWIYKIRNNYRHQMEDPRSTKGPRLSADKLQALQKCQFPWNARQETWRIKYQELCEFHEQHGHCRVPISSQNNKLGVWVRNQRREYKHLQEGKNTTLSQERLDLLHQLSFFGDLKSYQEMWEVRMEELKDFYKVHNHSNVPQDYEENYSLGQWVMNLRTQYKRYLAGLSTILTKARIADLQALDFRWNLRSYNWYSMFERLKQHSVQNDGNMDNLDYVLHIWVIKQRHMYQQRMQNLTQTMTDKRIQALEEIPGFSWRGRAAANRGPSVDNWAKLLAGIRQKGITPDMPPRQPTRADFEQEKDVYTQEDLLELWYQEE